jgi:hypothetical protein
MAKKIYCKNCLCFLGELAPKSKTRKDIIYLCKKCYNFLNKSTSPEMPEFFSDLFKNNKKY